MMRHRESAIVSLFLYSSGAILVVTAIAKFVSACGGARILQSSDPILGISFRSVFWLVGMVELIVAIVCFFGTRAATQTQVTAWLATSFVAYRAGLLFMGYNKPCSCLGNLTDALHISTQVGDAAMKIVLAYLLLGSYGILISDWLRSKRQHTVIAGQKASVGD